MKLLSDHMALHYRADGGLDMRYKSSKAAFAAGLCDSRGYSTSNMGLSFGSSSSTSQSRTDSTVHQRRDGGFDMRYKSSKQACAAGLCDNRGSPIGWASSERESKPSIASKVKVDAAPPATGSKSPKQLDSKFRQIGQKKRGNKEDGTEACHIVSHEFVSCVFRHTPGRMFGERQQEKIARELNSKPNLRTKSFDGNRWGSDGYSGDRYYDGMIINALDSTSAEDKILTNQGAVDRVRRIWETANNKLDLPVSFKQSIRDQLSQLRDQNGNVIIRANAQVNGY